MIGATALHTRAACDECGTTPATREAFGEIIVCERCNEAPPANDDALGSLLCGMIGATPEPRLPCARCSGPAFLRVDSAVILCADCWLEVAANVENDSSSVASAVPAPDVKVAAAVSMVLAPASAAVATPLSRDGASHSPIITTGDCPGTELTASRQNTLESESELSGLSGPGACGSERDGFGATDFRLPGPAKGAADGLQNDNTSAREREPVTSVTAGETDSDTCERAAAESGVTAGETATSFSSLNSFSGIGSARETSAMLHPGAVDGSTTKLAGRDSGDRAEIRSPNSSSGDGPGIQQPRSIEQGRARDRAICPAVSGNSSCGGVESRHAHRQRQGAAPILSRTVDRQARAGAGVTSGPQDSIFSCADPGPCCGDLDAIVSDLEAGWARDRRNSTTFRVVADNDSAANSKSDSEARA